ncbi:MAG: multicopper oxidase domain-containing protein, partial [Nitrosomonas sp.]|nr:multicopper oxidase domain-containing protein [Nitrosomonas sp.]
MKSIPSRLNKKPWAVLVAMTLLLIFSNVLLAATHSIELSTETLPNGQFGYQMISHTSSEGTTPNYPAGAVIPGPTLFVKLGDTVNITLTNNTSVDVGLNIPGLPANAEATASGGTQNYTFIASQQGTHPYYDEGSQMLGLFGAIVVDDADGAVQRYVDDDGTITAINRNELDKEYVLFMVGSTFWGAEIVNDVQTPLWTNPVLGAVLDDVVRFHVLSIEHDHTFH